MKVAITTTKELVSPELVISINLETNHPTIVLKHTCQKCAGWGCNTHSHNNDECNGGTISVKLEPKDLIKTLGPEFKSIIDCLHQDIIRQ